MLPRPARAARAPALPCALAVGGLDPGGGAGLAADLRAFAAAGVFGCAAAAVLTVQSTAGLRAVGPVASSRLLAQLDEVARHQRLRALKIGALGTPANVRALAGWLARRPRLPSVLDPVMLPTRGRARLATAPAVKALRRDLLPVVGLVTANAPEAAALTGAPVRTRAEARVAARALVDLGARWALVKGGHLEEAIAVDVLASDRGVVELAAPRLSVSGLHGGGCVLAALIAGRLARGDDVPRAVRWAKRVHHRAIAAAVDVGGPARVLVP